MYEALSIENDQHKERPLTFSVYDIDVEQRKIYPNIFQWNKSGEWKIDSAQNNSYSANLPVYNPVKQKEAILINPLDQYLENQKNRTLDEVESLVYLTAKDLMAYLQPSDNGVVPVRTEVLYQQIAQIIMRDPKDENLVFYNDIKALNQDILRWQEILPTTEAPDSSRSNTLGYSNLILDSSCDRANTLDNYSFKRVFVIDEQKDLTQNKINTVRKIMHHINKIIISDEVESKIKCKIFIVPPNGANNNYAINNIRPLKDLVIFTSDIDTESGVVLMEEFDYSNRPEPINGSESFIISNKDNVNELSKKFDALFKKSMSIEPLAKLQISRACIC